MFLPPTNQQNQLIYRGWEETLQWVAAPLREPLPRPCGQAEQNRAVGPENFQRDLHFPSQDRSDLVEDNPGNTFQWEVAEIACW